MGPRPPYTPLALRPPPPPEDPPPPRRKGGRGFFQEGGGGQGCVQRIFWGGGGAEAPFTAKTSPLFGENALVPRKVPKQVLRLRAPRLCRGSIEDGTRSACFGTFLGTLLRTGTF